MARALLLLSLAACAVPTIAPSPSVAPETHTFVPTRSGPSFTPLPAPSSSCNLSEDYSSAFRNNPSVELVSVDENQLFSYGLGDKSLKPWPKSDSQQVLLSVRVSPDGRRIAYFYGIRASVENIIEQRLRIAELGGKIVADIPWSPNWSDIHSWLTSDELLLSSKRGAKGELFVVNPFRQTERRLEPPPAVYNLRPTPAWWGVVYDHSLEFAFYIRESATGATATLWDTQLHSDIWSSVEYRVGGGGGIVRPEWSSDNKKLAFVGSSASGVSEMLIIHSDGTSQKITDFAGHYSSAEIVALAWSQDSRYLAFNVAGLKDIGKASLSYMVYDTGLAAFVASCSDPPLWGAATMSWLPDGISFLVADYSKGIYLFDITQTVIFRVEGEIKNMRVIGWMTP